MIAKKRMYEDVLIMENLKYFQICGADRKWAKAEITHGKKVKVYLPEIAMPTIVLCVGSTTDNGQPLQQRGSTCITVHHGEVAVP